jgi:hypothetical protein
LRGLFGGIKLNVNWRQRYNDQLMQLFGWLDILAFVSASPLNWIGRVSRTDSKRKVSQVFNNNPQGSRQKRRKKNRWWSCLETDILINVTLKT